MAIRRLSRRSFLAYTAAGSAALATATGQGVARAAPSATPPNIVFILVDDLGWKDLGSYGNRFIDTPHMDGLAAAGMRFTDAYSGAPVCSPTRASLMTGQAPARVGIWEVIHLNRWGQRPFGKMLQPPLLDALPAEHVTLAEALGEAGYTSACVGKWHLGGRPEDHGFVSASKTGDLSCLGPDLARDVQAFARRATAKQAGPWTAQAVRFIAERGRAGQGGASEPFFLYLCHKAVHAPLDAPDHLVTKYEAKAKREGVKSIHPEYAAMVEMVDQSVGLVLRTLETLRLADRTLVVLFSDNGGLVRDMRFDCPLVTSVAPLRSQKGDLYEGGIRVPLVVRWPGVVRPSTVCQTPVISHDLYPTLLGAAGATAPAGRPLDGASLVPLLKGTGGLAREALYWHFPTCSYDRRPMGAVRRGDFKLIEHYETGRAELYNLRKDIGEQNDLSGAMPEKTAALRRDLARWRKAVGARLPRLNPNHDPKREHLLPVDVEKAAGRTH